MKLVDMTREPSAADSMYATPGCMPSNPYPYGLRLNLTQDELAKLGYKELPPAGTELRLEAVGCVVRASSEDPDCDGDIDYLCVEVQITELGIAEEGEGAEDDEDEDGGEKAAGQAERLYSKGSKAA